MALHDELKQEELKNVSGGTYTTRDGIVLYRCVDLLFAYPGFQAKIYSPTLEYIGIGTMTSNKIRQDSTGYMNGTAYFEYNGKTYDFGTKPENTYHVGPV